MEALYVSIAWVIGSLAFVAGTIIGVRDAFKLSANETNAVLAATLLFHIVIAVLFGVAVGLLWPVLAALGVLFVLLVVVLRFTRH